MSVNQRRASMAFWVYTRGQDSVLRQRKFLDASKNASATRLKKLDTSTDR